jgi:hypothetical protein
MADENSRPTLAFLGGAGTVTGSKFLAESALGERVVMRSAGRRSTLSR